MKYSILGFNQKKVIEYIVADNGVELRCDLTDLLLLNYLIYAQSNTGMKHILDKVGQPCVWLQHEHLLKDLPILNITEGTLKNRLVKLRKMKLIESVTIANENSQGTRTYYKSTSLLNDLIFESTSLENDVVEKARHSKMTSNKQVVKNDKKVKNDNIEENFEFGKSKSANQSLYSKCLAEINVREYDDALRKALMDYLLVRLQIKDKPLYANSWKGLLNKLEREFKEDERIGVVFQSIERGYASFFPVSRGWRKATETQLDKPWEKGVTSRKATEEEEAENEAWLKQQRRKGVKVDF